MILPFRIREENLGSHCERCIAGGRERLYGVLIATEVLLSQVHFTPKCQTPAVSCFAMTASRLKSMRKRVAVTAEPEIAREFDYHLFERGQRVLCKIDEISEILKKVAVALKEAFSESGKRALHVLGYFLIFR